ncbi:MAG TPA: hypothetical protein VE959_05660 [Bryobacteraceae bacterium]|nr:hypothetical protein [Bryobacteraceae bacterium]
MTVKARVLMLNGRYDSTFPLATNQIPMFRMLGTPERDKRQVVEDGGHVPGLLPTIKETPHSYDRYPGPVTRLRP